MGNSDHPSRLNPGILQYIHEQYQRVNTTKSKKHLTVSQMLQIHAHEDFPFDFRHLGILFVCDADHDGTFSLQNLKYFAQWIQINLASVQMYEFKSQLQARTVQKIIQTFQKKDGENMLIQWVNLSLQQFIKMLLNDSPPKIIKNSTYIKIQSIKLIYEIFNIKVMSDLDIQTFFYLVKKSSEEMGFMIEEVKMYQGDQDFQEFIQIGVCKEFMLFFMKGALKILKEIGYSSTTLV